MLFFLLASGLGVLNSVQLILGWGFQLKKQNFLLLYLTLVVNIVGLVSMPPWGYSRGSFLWCLIVGVNSVSALAFVVKDFFLFFILFELSLFPMFGLMFGWGNHPERINAGMYLLFYTMCGSLPLLGCILMLKFVFGSLSLSYVLYLWSGKYMFEEYGLLSLFLIFAFIMKVPVFGLHKWLAKAHVEAPVVGSMVLAGMLLKLGGYGLLKISSLLCFSYNLGKKFFFWVISSAIVVSLMCFRNVDFKILIAYSSVVHMGVALAAMMNLNNLSLQGAMLVFLAHGMCSSGLFFSVKTFYEKTGSRSIVLKKGVLLLKGLSVLMWGLLCFFNGSLPPSLNFFSEVCLLISLKALSAWLQGFVVMIVTVNGLFKLMLYVWVAHGKWSSSSNYWVHFSNRSLIMGLSHLVILLLSLFLV